MNALSYAIDEIIKAAFIIGCICGAAVIGLVWLAVHVLA